MLISIITVTCNNEPGLRRTHRSVMVQNCTNYEWIVIDGASSDGTVEYLKTAQARWTSEPDRGIYDAMNKGIEKASGDYMIFMNAGDEFADGHVLGKLASLIAEKNAPDFIYGDALEERPGYPPVLKPARSHKGISYGMFTHHQAMIYRRAAAPDLRYDLSYKIAADYKFTLQFLKRCKTAIHAPFPVCLFESGGVSQRRTTLGRREQSRIRREEGACHPAANAAIVAAQQAALALKTAAPGLYWHLRRRA